MKKIFGALIIFVMLVSGMSAAYAADTADVTFAIDKETACPGDTISITVNIKGDTDSNVGFQGGFLRLTYDNTRLSFCESESTFGNVGEILTGYKKFTDMEEMSILNIQNYANVINDIDLPKGDCIYAIVKFKVRDDAPSGKIEFSAIARSKFTFAAERKIQYDISEFDSIGLEIDNSSVETVKPSKVSIPNKLDTLFIKQTYKIDADTEPAEAVNQVKWRVSDKALADVNPNTGIIIPKAVGTVTVTAVSSEDGSISDSFEAVIKPAPVSTVASASVSVYDTIYANSLEWDKDKSFRININLFDELGRYLKKSYWTDYYGIIYSDNFEGLKGIKRNGNTIVVSKDAQTADNLQITASVISKINGKTVCTAATEPFKVVGVLNVTDVQFGGADAVKNDDGRYSLKMNSDTLTFAAVADRKPYISYSLNNGSIICGDVKINTEDLKDGKNILVIYIYGDSRRSAAGYKLNSLAETIIAEIEK